MDKFTRSQILKLLVIVAFLIITPLLSSSLRPTYLYFVLNLLIIALGAEAGFLSSISKPAEEKKPAAVGSVAQNYKAAEEKKPSAVGLVTQYSKAAEKPVIALEATKPNDKDGVANTVNEMAAADHAKPKAKAVQKCSSEKISFVGSLKHKVKKCPSTPSLFFIGGGETEPEEFVEDDDQDQGVGEISGQELYHKAETFIGNFYKQLKMQREDSWKKLNELYHKAF